MSLEWWVHTNEPVPVFLAIVSVLATLGLLLGLIVDYAIDRVEGRI